MTDPKLQRPKAVLVGVQLGDVSDLEHTSSLAELGRQLGVSRERARQLDARARRKLEAQRSDLRGALAEAA